MSLEVSIIIINWNGLNFLNNCLNSIYKQSFRDFEIIIVDNGSNDGSVDYIKKYFPKVKIIKNKENKGFAEGNNIGIKYAKGRFIVLLNNDMIVTKNWLKELVFTIKSNSSIATVSSASYNKYRGKYEFFYGTSCFFGQNMIEKRIPKNNQDIIDIFGMAGGSCILRNNKKPIFDQDYFAYSEDTAFGWEQRIKGLQNKLNPKSIVYHEGEATGKKLKGKKIFLQERNRLLNVFIYYQLSTLIKLLPLLLINLIFLSIYDLFNIHQRIKAWFWLIFNIKKVINKRRKVQSQRKVNDKNIIKYMSCKFYEENLINNKFLKSFTTIMNRIQYYYCLILGLRTIEFKN